MNAPTSLAEGLPRRRFSVADVRRMTELGLIGEDERLEVLDGEIVQMSAKGNRHESMKGGITWFLGRNCPDDFRFIPETGLYLSEMTYLEPDFVVFSASVRLSELKGPHVLLAIEVADSSLGYDLHRKPPIYASFGVRELWVIDAAARETHVHRGVSPEGYASVQRFASHERLSGAELPDALSFALDGLEAF